MTLSLPPAWALTLGAQREKIEQAFGDELGFPIALRPSIEQAAIVATVDRLLDDDQIGRLLNLLAQLWPGQLVADRIGCEVVIVQDAGQMALRASRA